MLWLTWILDIQGGVFSIIVKAEYPVHPKTGGAGGGRQQYEHIKATSLCSRGVTG